MKKVISLLLAAVLVLTLFTACKKGEKKEAETSLPPQTQTTAPLQAKEGKSLDEIKTAFENAFGGRGYQELTACFIDNSDKYSGLLHSILVTSSFIVLVNDILITTFF